jgi:hypothetical protein
MTGIPLFTNADSKKGGIDQFRWQGSRHCLPIKEEPAVNIKSL